MFLKVQVKQFLSSSLLKFSADSKFLASGREDVDVRTLGRGRPFAVELPNPHRTILKAPELASLQTAINESAKGFVEVRDLQLIHK